MLKCIKKLFSAPVPLTEQPRATAPVTFEEYLASLPTCDHEPSENFYYRTEAADKWQQYFSNEFRVTCRNPTGGHSQDLAMDAVMRNASDQGQVHAFYYYTPFTCAQQKFASYQERCSESQLISFDKHWMTLCFLARYKKTPRPWLGEQAMSMEPRTTTGADISFATMTA